MYAELMMMQNSLLARLNVAMMERHWGWEWQCVEYGAAIITVR